MAKGLNEIHIICSDKDFLKTTMLKSIWIIVEITLYYEYETRQMNVNTNSLNGDLEEDVYIMTQTNVFLHSKISRKISKLWSSFVN